MLTAILKNGFETSNYYEQIRKLPLLVVGRIKKVISLMADKTGGKIVTKFSTAAPKTCL